MTDVTATLRKALTQLRTDRARIDRQIAAVESALGSLDGGAGRGARASKGAAKKAGRTAARRARRGMSAAQKKAISQRMKAYWAQRRKTAAK